MATTNPNTVIGYNKSRILATPGNIMRFPNEDIPYKMLLNFTEYSFATSSALTSANNQTANMVANPAGSIILPLPLQLADSTNVDASSVSAFDAAMISRAHDIMTKGGEIGVEDFALYSKLIAQGIAGAGASIAARGNKVLGGAVFGVGSALGAASGDTVQMLTGIAMNPFETMQFKGVRLKQHSFSWRLSPSSASESDTLRNIINRIKANILPEYYETNAKSAHALLKYPALATISFYGIDQNYYYKLKPCMITSFTVNYNGSDQLNVYRGGKPAIIDIRMDLTEMTIHTSGDYGGSTYTQAPTSNNDGLGVTTDSMGFGNEWITGAQ